MDISYLTQTLHDLVAINSINPSLVEGGAGEAQIAAYLAQAMQSLGLESHLHEVAPGRFNAVGVRRGSGGGRSLMWNGHIDTVGINGMERPFTPEIHQGRLYGRGSQDMKGSLAAMLAAVQSLNDSGVQLGGDLIIAGVADEEYSSLGTEDLLRHYTTDAAIVAEPTEMSIAVAHRGFIGFEIETAGRAAHGSRYQEGVDAILHMGRFLAELDGLEQELRACSPHPLVGPPSLHTSVIRGGTEMSTYPAQCYLMIERRTIPGETVSQAEQEVQALLDRCARQEARFQARLKTFMSRPAFEIGAEAHIVQTVSAVLQSHTGRTPELHGVSFWTDAALLSEAGIPCVLIGPTGHGLHSAEEWVDLQSCAGLAGVLAETAQRFCL
jgi:acetylornithine deacetylase